MPTQTRRSARSSSSSASSSSTDRRGKVDFSRPELTTPWQKFSGNVFVRVIGALILVGGTGALTWAAVNSTL